MHLGHDHHHHGGAGHNSGSSVTQWQTPHLPESTRRSSAAAGEPDIDLVEDAFVDAFPQAPDPTSFLRLAGVPFAGEAADGRRLNLLRVEIGQTTDIGILTPHLGGTGHRYDPLPAKLASRRRTLTLVYYDGAKLARLSLAEARALTDLTPAR